MALREGIELVSIGIQHPRLLALNVSIVVMLNLSQQN